MACQENAASLELVMKTVGEDVYWFNPRVLLKACNSLKENYSLNRELFLQQIALHHTCTCTVRVHEYYGAQMYFTYSLTIYLCDTSIFHRAVQRMLSDASFPQQSKSQNC